MPMPSRLAAFAVAALLALPAAAEFEVTSFKVPDGAHPHDVAPAADGGVWYTAQWQGSLGRLDPATGRTEHIPLGPGSRPHGVIVDPGGDAWVTDSGMNAIVRVGGESRVVTVFPLPPGSRDANLNTAAFDGDGMLWFTGQEGVYGRLDPASGTVALYEAPRGRGPYGIAATPSGAIYYASLAGNHIARVDTATGRATPLDPPTPEQGARRVWSDSRGRIWVSEFQSGQVSLHDPADGSWRTWPVPGSGPRIYAVYVDDRDIVWLSDFAEDAIVRFDPATERFDRLPVADRAGIRQMLGRPGELWAAASGTDELLRVRTR